MTFYARAVCNGYLDAKGIVERAGYATEIDWQHRASQTPVDEHRILREFAWVVLNAGMREATIRARFAAFSRAFDDWSSAELIWRNRSAIRRRALREFGYLAKIDAIIVAAGYLRVLGADLFRSRMAESQEFLQQLPFMGPATSRHLAKNLGSPVAKPDRHLQRISSIFSVDTDTLCHTISEVVGDPVPVVDIVLWRFSTVTKAPSETFLKMCRRYVGPNAVNSNEFVT